MNIKSIQTRIDEKAAARSAEDLRVLMVNVRNQLDELVAHNPPPIMFKIENKEYSSSLSYLLGCIESSLKPVVVLRAQSIASGEFLEKVEALTEQLESIQSQLP